MDLHMHMRYVLRTPSFQRSDLVPLLHQLPHIPAGMHAHKGWAWTLLANVGGLCTRRERISEHRLREPVPLAATTHEVGPVPKHKPHMEVLRFLLLAPHLCLHIHKPTMEVKHVANSLRFVFIEISVTSAHLSHSLKKRRGKALR